MKISISGIEQTLLTLSVAMGYKTSELLMHRTEDIRHSLVTATPIDTGRAQAGWQLKGKTTIINDVPYIDELNHGHSRQAPTHFIEQTLLKHGKAVGALVINTPT